MPDVVHEHVEPAERVRGLADRTFRLPGCERSATTCAVAPRSAGPSRRPQVTTRAPSPEEEPRGLEADPGRRARHEAPPAASPRSTGGLAYPAWRRRSCSRGTARRTGTAKRRFQGHSDVPLNDVGRAQAEELAAQLAGEAFATAYASPLRRALETAEIVGARLGSASRPTSGCGRSTSARGPVSRSRRSRRGSRRVRALGRRTRGRLGRRRDLRGAGRARRRRVSVEIALGIRTSSVLVVTHGGPHPSRSARAGPGGPTAADGSARRDRAVLANCARSSEIAGPRTGISSAVD